MSLFLDDGDVRLYHGDALETLRQLPDGCVDMVATSPPFYGLRDYGSEGQIGLEETPDQWVANLVAVFAECRRVLADHGTLWVEIGDSYAANRTYQVKQSIAPQEYGEANATRVPEGMKQKDLMGMPWELAFALRTDGWYLRSEIIWARPNPMPESVTDRPTKAHSTVFLLSKRPRYFYDADAIREPVDPKQLAHNQRYARPYDNEARINGGQPRNVNHVGIHSRPGSDAGANARSVWQISTEPTPFAHFATWPRKLVTRMILAGTSERGKCPVCGKPWVRETRTTTTPTQRVHNGNYDASQGRATSGSLPGKQEVQTLGWSPSCDCFSSEIDEPPHSPVPCTVLDPFAGSGTTCLVARNLGRHAVGIELNAEYLRIAADRLSQLSLLTEAHQ